MRLQQLVSPSLPIGAFTYSQGMEWACEGEWLRDAASVKAWLASLMASSMAEFELPLIRHMKQALEEQDSGLFSYLAQIAWAGRETSELRLEEQQRGKALLTLLQQLPASQNWPELTQQQAELGKTQLAGFSLACYHWQVDLESSLLAYLWSWLENQITVAIKTVPLGQTQGQVLLTELCDLAPQIIELSLGCEIDDLGASTPALSIASSLHETQYCRLFRS